MASIHKTKGARKMQQHPLSAAFPGMSEKELEELIRDIEAHGQRDPITLFEGMVLDGWHRYLACSELGIMPDAQDLPDDEDPVAFVQSKNLHRRHLTGSQRAAAVVACAGWAPKGTNQHGGSAPGAEATTSKMAEAADVSPRTIEHAKRAHEAGLGEAVRDGKVTAKEAAEIAKLPEPERQAAIEAPPAPKPKPAPAPKVDDLAAEVLALRQENTELKGHVQELLRFNDEAKVELDSLHRILDAEDLRSAFAVEVKRNQELARVIQSRNNGLMVENHDLSGRLRSALRKVERLEKQLKGAEGQGAGSEPEVMTEDDICNATFGEAS